MTAKKITFERLPTLNNYYDWFEKAKYDLQVYQKTLHVYDLANCFLTLNSTPEWMQKSNNISNKLKNIADEKVRVMKGQDNFEFDENQLSDINHKLRFIRIFCNHAKHSEKKKVLPQISMCIPLPATFPIAFTHIEIGNISIEAITIIEDVIAFWSSIIGERPKD